MSVARAQAEIDAEEFAWWVAYDRVDPIGRERFDLLAGILSSVVANVNRGKGTPMYKPKDFMPQYERGLSKQQSPEAMQNLLRFYFMQNGNEMKGA